MDILENTFGSWQRKETAAQTVKHIKQEIRRKEPDH